MFIATERTPNPDTMKFLPGRPVAPAAPADFADPTAAGRSPLATSLFALGSVSRVFLGSDFVTVTRADDAADWAALKPEVLGVLLDHFASGAPVLTDDQADEHVSTDDPADAEIVAQIRELIDTRVRPAVAQDGGDIVYRGFDRGVVYLHMQGSCAGCPSSTATLKGGIENLLKYYVPEVVDVRAV